MPKISILMPVYNSEKYLREAIDSIITQTFTDWELLIINDGSTDTSKSIIKTYSDSRIRYIENEKNIGLIDTLNKGIECCQGDYVARMDSDDISMPDRLASQLSFMQKNIRCAVCGTNAIVIDQAGRETGKIVNVTSNEYLQVNLLFSVPFIHPSMMFRTNVLKLFNYNKESIHAEDYDLWCRIADEYEISNIPSDLLKYRWHTTNVSVIHQEAQRKIKDKILIKQLLKIGLQPNQEELRLHKISFEQNRKNENGNLDLFSDFSQLDDWFSKIIRANNTHRKYSADVLRAYLWSRWIVLCIAQKQYTKILKPSFISLKPNIRRGVFYLLSVFRQKR